MTGLFLLFVMAIWFVIAVWLANFITSGLQERWWRTIVRIFAVALLFALPLTDEIIGRRQFEQLCRDNSTIQVDRQKAAGRTVYLKPPPDTYMKGTWVPIRLQQWRFFDATTDELVVSYNVLHATGGRLIRALGISEGNEPLTFKGYCAPGGRLNYLQLFREIGVTEIQAATIKHGENK